MGGGGGGVGGRRTGRGECNGPAKAWGAGWPGWKLPSSPPPARCPAHLWAPALPGAFTEISDVAVDADWGISTRPIADPVALLPRSVGVAAEKLSFHVDGEPASMLSHKCPPRVVMLETASAPLRLPSPMPMIRDSNALD